LLNRVNILENINYWSNQAQEFKFLESESENQKKFIKKRLTLV